MLFGDTSLSLEPAWPWSLPALGLPALWGAAVLLAALTVWTYVGVKNATWRRVGLVLLLRLSALLIAFSMMLRPSFAITELQGVEVTKLLVVFDASESMNVAETEGKPSRWEQLTKLWESPEVQRRLDRLRIEQKIEVGKYLGDETLRPDEPNASPAGKRTDIGAWLHLLHQKHAHEKHLRGILLFSDGADNGKRFSAQEKASQWRGLAAIHAFGVGDPNSPKFRKDIGLTSLRVDPILVPVKSKMTVKAIAQAPGFENTDHPIQVFIKNKKVAEVPAFHISRDKDQAIDIVCDAPDEPGEYELTLKVTPHPDESNVKNNEISTFVQVIKPEINVLWVDRPRVYEQVYAIRELMRDPRFKVFQYEPPTKAKAGQDPVAFYKLAERHYDVIVIGDISTPQFTLGNDKEIFQVIRDMVIKKKTGLLMLGGTETFAKGGWTKHADFMDLLPVKFDGVGAAAEYAKTPTLAAVVAGAPELPFLKLDPDVAKNKELWETEFEELAGLAPLGSLAEGATKLLAAKNDSAKLIMAATRKADGGHVVVFGTDDTWSAWRLSPKAVAGQKKFWKQLIYWLANQEDRDNQLVIQLDKRRVNANAGEILGFSFYLRGKNGVLPGATFKAKIVGPKQEHAVTFVRDGDQQRGAFQNAKDPGEHRLVVEGKDGDVIAKAEARFLVAMDDIELLRPIAEHETLMRIAANADGHFHVLNEADFLQYLDGLKTQVNRDARLKTTHWPDWTRLPASPNAKDQLSGLWHSFGLFAFLLFVALLCGEWGLRRMWGWV